MSPEKLDEHHFKLDKYEYLDGGTSGLEIINIFVRGPQIITIENILDIEEIMVIHSGGVAYFKGKDLYQIVKIDKFSRQFDKFFRQKTT